MTLVVRQAMPEDHALFVPFFLSFEMPDPVPDLEWWTRYSRNACFVEEDGRAVGYGLAYKLAESGYVMHCAVDASARNRGVGRAVMLALAGRLREQGCTLWGLNVKDDNAPALALYRRLGMEVAHGTAILSVPWSSVDAMPPGAGTVESFDRGEDRRVEDSLAIERVGSRCSVIWWSASCCA